MAGPTMSCGWKVARIGAQWQKQYPEERLIGPVFSRNVHVSRRRRQVAVCPVFEGGFAAVEAEIGVYVRADAPPDKIDWTAELRPSRGASVCIGVEVASSPLVTFNDLGPGAVVSDFGNNWGVIVGADVCTTGAAYRRNSLSRRSSTVSLWGAAALRFRTHR